MLKRQAQMKEIEVYVLDGNKWFMRGDFYTVGEALELAVTIDKPVQVRMFSGRILFEF